MRCVRPSVAARAARAELLATVLQRGIMPSYELTFVTGPIDEAAADSIGKTHDVLVSEHSGVHLLTIVCSGPDGFSAARDIVDILEHQYGMAVLRYHDDLVSRADIAERAGVSTQAVRQWIGGAHRSLPRFPPPHNLVTGGVWRWGAVLGWLDEAGRGGDAPRQPTWEEAAAVEHWLAGRRHASKTVPDDGVTVDSVRRLGG